MVWGEGYKIFSVLNKLIGSNLLRVLFTILWGISPCLHSGLMCQMKFKKMEKFGHICIVFWESWILYISVFQWHLGTALSCNEVCLFFKTNFGLGLSSVVPSARSWVWPRYPPKKNFGLLIHTPSFSASLLTPYLSPLWVGRAASSVSLYEFSVRLGFRKHGWSCTDKGGYVF